MVLPNRLAALNAQLPGELAAVEGRIAREFSQRLHGFHIAIRDDGLVLEGRTRSYFSKQLVQQAVVNAIDLPIVANNIVVDAFPMATVGSRIFESDAGINFLHSGRQ